MQGASDITTVIPVSEEMLAVIGTSAGARSGWPNNSVAFAIDLQSALAPASFRFIAMPSEEQLTAPFGEQSLFLIVRRNACERLRGGQLSMDEKQRCLLTPQLHPIVIAIRDCTLPAASALPYRLAKCIELLCEILEADRHGALVPVVDCCTLSSIDRRRIVASRMLIDERWSEPLTLDLIARQCGINRSKLSRGFREIYGTSVADAISERRLEQAHRALLGTDLPVGLIGYRSGYQNNASFTRAFGRRYGMPPSSLRSRAN